MRFVLITPLAAAWIWGLWSLFKQREYRLLVPIALLPALALRHYVYPGAPESWIGYLAEVPLARLLVDATINLSAALATVLFCGAVRERNRAEQIQWRTLDVLGRVADFFVESDGAFENRVKALLQLGCQELGMEAGVFLVLRDGEYEIAAVEAPDSFAFTVGDRLELETTFCQAASEVRATLAIENTALGHWARHPARELQNAGCYLGTPIRVGGEVEGSLYFTSVEARTERFTSLERTVLELMAHWLTAALEHRRTDRDRLALTRLQSAALEFSHLALEAEKTSEPLTPALERIVKTLDFAGAAIVREIGAADDLETIASVGVPASEIAVDLQRFASSTRSGEASALGDQGVLRLGSTADPASAICIPLRFGDERLGSLIAYGYAPRAFSPEEIDFLRLVANLISESVASAIQPLPREEPEETGQRAVADARPRLLPRRSAEVEPQRLELNWAIRRLVDEIRARGESAPAIALDLALDAPEVELYRYEFDRIGESLIAYGADLSAHNSLTFSTSLVTAPTDASHSADYVLLSIRAADARLDAQGLSELYEAPPAESERVLPESALPLSRVERLLKDRGGDLSVSADGEGGVMFTVYLRVARLA